MILKRVSLFLILAAFLVITAPAQSTFPMGPYGTVSWNGVVILPPTTATTLPAYQMVGVSAAALTTDVSHTTASATDLCNLFPFVATSAAASFNWDWFVKNTAAGANTLTILAGTGVTISGTATVAQNNIKHFKVNISGCNSTPAAVVYSLGSSVF